MVARVFLPLILVFGALVIVGIVFPTLNGPFRVDCGELVPEVCDQIWREAALHEEGPTGLLPVTRVRVDALASTPDVVNCNTVYLERWIFATTVTQDCL